MIVRRVVTGHAEDGSSVVRMDGQPPRVIQLPGFPDFCGALVWSTSGVPELAGNIEDPTPDDASFVPAAGGSRLHVMHFPPDSVMWGPGVDTAAVAAEQRAQMPGLAEVFEADGMHTTDTLDYAIVLKGQVCLELDNGVRTELAAGDVVIQQGTRHAWRNTSDDTVTMAFVLIGAKR
jgi:uncharacterized cupin superfamily protein